MKTITSLLAEAYNLVERDFRRDDAIALLRGALNESSDLRDAAEIEKQRIDSVIRKRGPRACHVSATYQSLLHDALAG